MISMVVVVMTVLRHFVVYHRVADSHAVVYLYILSVAPILNALALCGLVVSCVFAANVVCRAGSSSGLSNGSG